MMRPFALALTLAAVGLLPTAHAQPVPPAELTVEALRARAAAYLADPAKRDELEELNANLVLSVEGLTYTRATFVVGWRVALKPGVTLTEAETRLMVRGLKEVVLPAVLRTYKGGLLTPDARVEFDVRIAGGPPAAEKLPGVPAVPRMSSVIRWDVIPNPPGSCIPADFVLYDIPVPVLPPAVWHGIWKASDLRVETWPPMEKADDAPPATPLEPIDVTGLRADDAPRLLWRGRGLYFGRDHAAAARELRASVRLAPDDARAWYFLALAERARGDRAAADAALETAVGLHRRALPRSDEIGRALERVQGADRRWLREALDRAG